MGIPKRDFEAYGRDGFWLKSFQVNGNLGLKMRTLENSSLYPRNSDTLPRPPPPPTLRPHAALTSVLESCFAQQILQNEGAKREGSLGQKL